MALGTVQSRRQVALAVGAVGDDSEISARVRDSLAGANIPAPLEARTVEDLRLAAGDCELDVLILQVHGDETALTEAVNASRSALPGVPLVAVWQSSEGADQRRALRLGLQGVIPSDELEKMLVATVQAVSVGLVCVPRALRNGFTRENLSSREKQILGLLVMGFTNAEIASRLFLAESTVKSHLSTAYDKLGVRSRKDAAAMILDPAVGLDRGIMMISAA